jgi:hypothetical protein
MSNANDPKASSAGATPSKPTPPPATAARAPAPPPPPRPASSPLPLVALGVGVVALGLGAYALLAPPQGGADDQRWARIDQRLGAIERQASSAATRQSVDAIDGRLKAVEARPAAGPATDLGPIRAEIGALTQRIAATPAASPDIAALRQALEALATRVQGAETAATQAANQRVAALEQQLAQRMATLEQQIATRAGALEQSIGQRVAAAEQASRRVGEIEQRTVRLAALDTVQAMLEAGLPLGAALNRLSNPPEALSRFATTAPPTDASLRLSFEQAARAARAAADPGTSASGERGSVADAAVARLSALVTVRRGEQVVWGDSAEGEIAQARAALAAGDIALALEQVGKLPPSARQAMAAWVQQAQALLAARTALRQLLAG